MVPQALLWSYPSPTPLPSIKENTFSEWPPLYVCRNWGRGWFAKTGDCQRHGWVEGSELVEWAGPGRGKSCGKEGFLVSCYNKETY